MNSETFHVKDRYRFLCILRKEYKENLNTFTGI